jgi:drug/metabolite transporter (DMT)-like permease
VATVILAHVLLGERLTREQQLGIAVALGGVVAISAG